MLSPVSDSDIPDVVSLMNQAYRGAGSSAGWTTEAGYIAGDRTSAEFIRAQLAAAPDAVFLKWTEAKGGPLVGCVWLEPVGGGIWYLGSLAANPARQGGGLGRTILAAAENWVAARGGTSIRMSVVNVRDTLIAWYERRGYHRTGEIEPFPYGDNRFGTPMRPDLEFVILAKHLLD